MSAPTLATVEVFGPDVLGKWIVNGHAEVFARTQDEACVSFTERTGDEAWSAFPAALTCDGCGSWPSTHTSSCAQPVRP